MTLRVIEYPPPQSDNNNHIYLLTTINLFNDHLTIAQFNDFPRNIPSFAVTQCSMSAAPGAT